MRKILAPTEQIRQRIDKGEGGEPSLGSREKAADERRFRIAEIDIRKAPFDLAGGRIRQDVGANFSLEALASDLARLEQRVVLFLDDLHFVRSPEVLETLDWLVNYAPRTLQPVIGSREKPALRLSGLRVRRQLFELDMGQLRFDREEAAQFYRKRLGQDLPNGYLERLLAKTEGWPAALELVALALSGVTDRGEFIEHFAGTDSSLVEYLGEVLLSQLDERNRAFVSRISMFDRINGSLAQALGEADTEERLQALMSRNLGTLPSSGRRVLPRALSAHPAGAGQGMSPTGRSLVARQWVHRRGGQLYDSGATLGAGDTLGRRQRRGAGVSPRLSSDDLTLDQRPSGG